MTRLPIILLGLGLVCLAGCTTLEERQRASGGYDYLEDPEVPAYRVPEGMDQPPVTRDYAIPDIGENAPADLVGDKLTIVSPALVLPLVTGSHVEEGLKEATIWFDKVDDSQPLDTTIWNSLINFLEEQGIGVTSFDKDAQTLVTDWMIIEEGEEEGWFNWTSTERSVGRRFEFTLDLKPHGRTASLKAEMKDYLETRGDDVIADLDAEAERRNEVDVLNQIISHYENQIRVADARRLQRIRSGLDMELGFDANGEPAYVVTGEYDVVWPRLLLVLRKLGFNVKDLDKSNGLLFVNYGGPDEGWWSRLWSDSKDELDLTHDDYRLQVNPMGGRTSIVLMNEESEPFNVSQITELFQPFASSMADENLDI